MDGSGGPGLVVDLLILDLVGVPMSILCRSTLAGGHNAYDCYVNFLIDLSMSLPIVRDCIESMFVLLEGA